MLKTKSVKAVSIQLADNIEAVFLPKGDRWNGMQEWRCIAPGAFAGDLLVTVRCPDSGPFFRVLEGIFGEVEEEPIVLASPGLAAALKAMAAAA